MPDYCVLQKGREIMAVNLTHKDKRGKVYFPLMRD